MDGSIRKLHSNPVYIPTIEMDDELLVSIYQKYYKNIYNYICYRINNLYDAEDLASMVFENAIRKFNTYNSLKSPIEAWLIGIAKNIVTDYFRRNSRKSFISLDTVTNSVSNHTQPDDLIVLSEEHKTLMVAMSKLKDKERQILSLRFATDLKTSDIAKFLGITETNVGVKVHRCVKKLRKIMEKDGVYHE